MADSFLPYGHQSIDDTDIAAVAEVLRGDFLTTGPKAAELEEAFVKATGAEHALCCSSGTAALHLAALVLGLGEGDWVVVPSLTFLATANAARFVGAEVQFADVDPDTGLMTPETLDAALVAAAAQARRVRAVFPVHLNGQCCDISGIRRIAQKHGFAVVEDACHALGGTDMEGVPVGACTGSDIAVFSLHPVKVITSGEGGVITTNDTGLAERLGVLRNHGILRESERFQNADLAFDGNGAPNPWYYEMQEIGFNYRLSDIQAALALCQLGKLESFVARRRELVALYDEALAEMAPVLLPAARLSGVNPAWHLYAVLIDFDAAGVSRALVMNRLREAGIGTQVHYLPVHRQPYYSQRYDEIKLPGADAYYSRALSLPLYPAMADEDVERVVEALANIMECCC